VEAGAPEKAEKLSSRAAENAKYLINTSQEHITLQTQTYIILEKVLFCYLCAVRGPLAPAGLAILFTSMLVLTTFFTNKR
jgi:hypothetical protein